MYNELLTVFVVALSAIVLVVCFFLHKEKSKERNDSNEHLKQIEDLSRLTGELAHEIKNPLSTIKVNLKLASEDLEDSKSNGRNLVRAISKIVVVQKEADRLEQILNGFLRYIDRSQLHLSEVDINELISDMVDFYSPQAYSHSITIRQGLYDNPLICKIDINMLKQAILNLFINAQQAMESDGELMIRTSRQQDEAVIHINDTGRGIGHDKISRIFDIHYSSRPQGSGLGLPTTKKIVEMHKGTIAVNSELEKGTSFVIKLPLLKVNDSK